MTHHFDTQVIHAGQEPDPHTGAVITPIYATSTYAQPTPGQHKGFEYTRTGNPTRLAYEKCMAELECGTHAYAFASGMAAASTLLEVLDSGDHVLAMDDLYGGTYRLFENVRRRSANLQFTFADLSVLDNIQKNIQKNTRMIWIESPTNPMLKLADLTAIAEIARKNNIITVVDNTFASPWIQQPIKMGIDIVMHSATKYLNGHSDVVGGITIVGEKKELAEKIQYLQNAVGAVASPFDSFLVLRGLKTLSVRMERHSHNAQALAEWLTTHPQVEKVYYPGLSQHPQHALMKKQMRTGGGMIGIVVRGGLDSARKALSRCQIFALAESLGGVESLIESPALMTHAAVPSAQRQALGIIDGFIRLSVGIESLEDLRADLTQALG